MTSPMDEDYPADAPGYLDTDGREYGFTDSLGRRWVHVPYQGMQEQRHIVQPTPQREMVGDRLARAFWVITLAAASVMACVAMVGMTLAYGWPVPVATAGIVGAGVGYVFGPRRWWR